MYTSGNCKNYHIPLDKPNIIVFINKHINSENFAVATVAISDQKYNKMVENITYNRMTPEDDQA